MGGISADLQWNSQKFYENCNMGVPQLLRDRHSRLRAVGEERLRDEWERVHLSAPPTSPW